MVKSMKNSAQKLAVIANGERIQNICSDRWIAYTRAQAALERLDGLLKWPRKQRMPNVLLIGPTNNGKTMIIEKFRKDHTISTRKGCDHELVSVVVVQMPCEPSVARFYAMTLASLGAPINPRMRVVDLEQLALRVLRTVQAQVLIIDEVHNILAGTLHVRRALLNLLRFLGNELRIPIVGVGTREAYLAISTDDQLENRFEPLSLPRWEEGEELLALLESFSATFPLKQASVIATDDMSKYILERTGGTIGEITRLLTAAAIEAVNTGEECINQRTLKLANYQSPRERRRDFERS
jgi:type II secretory pathway predicted ATPase ExeA